MFLDSKPPNSDANFNGGEMVTDADAEFILGLITQIDLMIKSGKPELDQLYIFGYEPGEGEEILTILGGLQNSKLILEEILRCRNFKYEGSKNTNTGRLLKMEYTVLAQRSIDSIKKRLNL